MSGLRLSARRRAERLAPCGALGFTVAALLCFLLPLLPAAEAKAALTLNWSVLGPGSVDGTALGDLDGDGRLEVVVLARGGSYAPGSTVQGIGGVGAFASDGSLLWVSQTGQELAGFPTVADFDGDGLGEVAFCEMAATGFCHVLDGDGTLLYSVGPLYYPGMASSGPTATDINGDGAADLIVTSWGGSLAAYDGVSGLQLWRTEAWPTLGELFFGHAAITKVGGSPAVVLGGYAQGGLYAFSLASGALLWSVPGTATVDGATLYGSGPAIADLNADGRPEVLVATVGLTPAVSAYDDLGTLLWRSPLPGASLYWMSPVVADVDPASAGPEVLMQSGDGTLYKLDANGSLLGSVSIGAAAWTSPSVVDANLDGRPDVVAGNPSDVVILDGASFAELDRYTDPVGGLFPAPVVADLNRDGRVDLATASWWSHDVLALGAGVPALFQWTATAGSPTHTGAASSGAGVTSGNPADLVNVLQQMLLQIAADPAIPAKALKDPLKQVGSAFKDLIKGDKPSDIIKHLGKALKKLPTSLPGYNLTLIKQLMTQAALLTLQNYIDRARAIMGPTDPAVVAATASLQQAQAQLAAGQFAAAIKTAESASKTLEKKVRYKNNFCPTTGQGPFLPLLCQLQTARDEILALQTQSSASALADAQNRIQRAMEKLVRLKIKDSVKELRKAAERLMSATGVDPSLALAPIGQAAKRLTRIFLDDAIAFGISAKDAAAAEKEYAAGLAALSAGNTLAALKHFEKAVDIARP